LRVEGETLQKQNHIREAIAKYRESLKLVPDPLLEQHIQMLERALQTAAVTMPPVAPLPQPNPAPVPTSIATQSEPATSGGLGSVWHVVQDGENVCNGTFRRRGNSRIYDAHWTSGNLSVSDELEQEISAGNRVPFRDN